MVNDPPDQVRPGLGWGGVWLPNRIALPMESELEPTASGAKVSRISTCEPLTFTPVLTPMREMPTVTFPEPVFPAWTLTCAPPEVRKEPWEDAPA